MTGLQVVARISPTPPRKIQSAGLKGSESLQTLSTPEWLYVSELCIVLMMPGAVVFLSCLA